MNRSNMDVRNKAMEKGIPLWRIAEHIGMSESGFSRKMRYELSEEFREKVFEAINTLTDGK